MQNPQHKAGLWDYLRGAPASPSTFKVLPPRNGDVHTPAMGDQCTCRTCSEFQEAIQQSEQDAVLSEQWQTLEDEQLARCIEHSLTGVDDTDRALPDCTDDANYAEALALSEQEHIDSLFQAEMEDHALAALLQGTPEASTQQQIREDEELARQTSQQSSESAVQRIIPGAAGLRRRGAVHDAKAVKSISSLHISPPSQQQAIVPQPHYLDPPSYEESLTGCSVLPGYTAAPA